ncbi:GNAT family N-acetyltransferase [Shouchella hunanensis]|uniref:GNAT family N-acetyltransferase n=1 Tax=Shouchella hunanensis TaxID=766894 RepID=A0ABY7W0D4_9BACI|nr:GNAT family N-acetyltransferase [Shouchella hunanensis]WDF02422.1 GNAT family N-acetyltransferase [Shouchella hunanensis]
MNLQESTKRQVNDNKKPKHNIQEKPAQQNRSNRTTQQGLKLERLRQDHETTLYQFEQTNRTYFETMVPSRGETFYQKEAFRKSLEELIKEEESGQGLFYLIFNKEGALIGRLNLTINGEMADVGYRIGEAFSGRGYAKKALALGIEEAQSHPYLQKVTAKTTSAHVASQKVLVKNGFHEIGRDNESFMWKGKAQQFVYYERSVI